MRSLSPADFLDLWERGWALHAVDQALLVLHCACPEYTYEKLATLSLGQRDTLLVQVRRLSLGDRLEAYTECPACHERLEFVLSCDELRGAARDQESLVKSVTLEGSAYTLRCPDSRDAAAAAASENVDAARLALLARCVVPRDDSLQAVDMLPAAVQTAMAAELAAMDPQAEMLLDLACPACGHTWLGVFEIVTFLWSEIRARARRLLQEVDALARAYGWREADVLQMSETRRGLYLQMAVP
jgi:hypothetical protein